MRSLLFILNAIIIGGIVNTNVFVDNVLFLTNNIVKPFTDEEKLYQIAARYIINDFEEKDVCVSDKRVGTYYLFFSKELQLNDSTAMLLDEQYKPYTTCEKQEDFFINTRKCKYIAYFSNLIASKELFCCVTSVSHGNITFGESTYYYIRFKNDSIEYILKQSYHGL